MYRITKEFAWSASHQLAGLPEGHQCGRLHGHNYTATVVVEAAQLDEHGFVIDFGELAFVKRYIDAFFDHRHLNDVLDFQPSAENLARYLVGVVVAGLDGEMGERRYRVSVAVSETPKTTSSWEGPWIG